MAEENEIQFDDIPVLNSNKSEIFSLIDFAINQGASDMILSSGCHPSIRVDGNLVPVLEKPKLTSGYIEKLVSMLLNEDQKEDLEEKKELDFSYIFKDQAFLRINAFYQKNTLACVVRIIPSQIRSFEELNLPASFSEFAKPTQGLILVAGPSGSGKSTTIAAILEEINRTRKGHILTIEDPIEYVFKSKQSIINQRELKRDTLSVRRALKSALREDFDVLFIGELRDNEDIEAALDIAETGHLVFATIHSGNAYTVPDRIVGVFPEHQQNQVKNQLANVLLGVIAQRLLPKPDGGRVPALEILMANGAIRNLIREGKTSQIKSIMEVSRGEGMLTFDQSIEELKKEKKII